MDETTVLICLGILFFLVFSGKNKKRETPLEEKIKTQEDREEVKTSPPPRPSPLVSKKKQPIHPAVTRSVASSYEVQRKKRVKPLVLGWKDKSSLKQAFILSEILKRKDGL